MRISGQWIKLSHALQPLIDGSDVMTGDTDAYRNEHYDGGDFTNNTPDAGLPLNTDDDLDGGVITQETWGS